MPPDYELGPGYIICLHCQMVSYNLGDIEQLYCGHCHRFHDKERSGSSTDIKQEKAKQSKTVG
jgi:hypothetical protein